MKDERIENTETKENKTTKIKHTHTYYIFYYLHWLLCVFFYCSFIQMYNLQRNSWFNLNTYCSYRNTAFKNIHYWNKVINLKLGQVLSFTTEIIYKVPWVVGWFFPPPQFMNNVQILENDTLGPKMQLPAHRLLVTLLVTQHGPRGWQRDTGSLGGQRLCGAAAKGQGDIAKHKIPTYRQRNPALHKQVQHKATSLNRVWENQVVF